MKNYQCKKCELLLQSPKQPSTSGCTAGGSHQWVDLGETGTQNYQCKKCGVLLQSAKQPSTSGCTSGGSHTWQKL
jgi:rubredoxin